MTDHESNEGNQQQGETLLGSATMRQKLAEGYRGAGAHGQFTTPPTNVGGGAGAGVPAPESQANTSTDGS